MTGFEVSSKVLLVDPLFPLAFRSEWAHHQETPVVNMTKHMRQERLPLREFRQVVAFVVWTGHGTTESWECDSFQNP